MESRAGSVPRVVTNSSLTIFTTCWPGVRLLVTSVPTARSFTRLSRSWATATFTSASSRASLISRSGVNVGL